MPMVRDLTSQELRLIDRIRDISPVISGWVYSQLKAGRTREQIWDKISQIRDVLDIIR